MKKLFGIILLAVLLTITAGCVATEDEIVGTWRCESTDEDGVTEVVTQTLKEDGTGTVIYSYPSPDGYENYSPVLWAKLEDKTYLIAEMHTYTFSEDQKTMTDDWRMGVFTLEEGEDKIGGVWTERGDYSVVYTVVFNKDGTGIRTVSSEEDNPEESPFAWREVNENQIAWWDLHTLPYTEDGLLLLRDGSLLTQTDGVWEGSSVDGIYTVNGEVIGDFWVEKYSLIENGEYQFTYWYKIQQKTEEGMVVGFTNAYTMTLQEDGTLLGESGDVFTKLTA